MHVHGFYAKVEVIVELRRDGTVLLADRKDAQRSGDMIPIHHRELSRIARLPSRIQRLLHSHDPSIRQSWGPPSIAPIARFSSRDEWGTGVTPPEVPAGVLSARRR
jgi:hypothetical protein